MRQLPEDFRAVVLASDIPSRPFVAKDSRVAIPLPHVLTEHFQHFCREENVRVFRYLLTGLHVLFYRLTGQLTFVHEYSPIESGELKPDLISGNVLNCVILPAQASFRRMLRHFNASRVHEAKIRHSDLVVDFFENPSETFARVDGRG
jgi:hypothetical protein